MPDKMGESNSDQKAESKTRGLLWFGGLATCFYMGFIVGSTSMADFAVLKLNERGDFLAGLFAPLAFLWLVIGYFMQSSELKQNREALVIQAGELSNSVEQQTKMANVASAELELLYLKEKLQSDPLFEIKEVYQITYEDRLSIEVRIVNRGALARAAFGDLLDPVIFQMDPKFKVAEWKTNRIHQVVFSCPASESFEHAIGAVFRLAYVDIAGNNHAYDFTLGKNEHNSIDMSKGREVDLITEE